MVSLYVETYEQPYKVQRTMLTRISKWFERALNGNFVEAQKQELDFPGISAKTLELFLFWLFEGEVACSSQGNVSKTYDPERKEQLEQVRLWIFADQHLMPTLQNEVMERLEDLSADLDAQIPLTTVRIAYENTPPGSCMRHFMMDQVCKGLFYGPGTAKMGTGDQGYPVRAVAGLNDIPGFVEDLLERYHKEMISQCDPRALNVDNTRYYVDEVQDEKGSA